MGNGNWRVLYCQYSIYSENQEVKYQEEKITETDEVRQFGDVFPSLHENMLLPLVRIVLTGGPDECPHVNLMK